MRNFVNQKAKNIKPSGIRKFFDIVRETEGAISLGVGEPDFVTPWKVRSAAITSLQRGYTQYTGNRGLPALLQLISRYLNERFSLEYDPAHILVTVGGSEAIDLALRACVESGDEVLIPDPAYVSYSPLVAMSDGVPGAVQCREEDNFVLRPEYLEQAVTDKTKAIILTYPNNPTGAIMTREQLEEIAKVIVEKDLLVITDEIYAELTYGRRHTSIASLPGMKERTIYISGFSKAVTFARPPRSTRRCSRSISTALCARRRWRNTRRWRRSKTDFRTGSRPSRKCAIRTTNAVNSCCIPSKK